MAYRADPLPGELLRDLAGGHFEGGTRYDISGVRLQRACTRGLLSRAISDRSTTSGSSSRTCSTAEAHRLFGRTLVPWQVGMRSAMVADGVRSVTDCEPPGWVAPPSWYHEPSRRPVARYCAGDVAGERPDRAASLPKHGRGSGAVADQSSLRQRRVDSREPRERRPYPGSRKRHSILRRQDRMLDEFRHEVERSWDLGDRVLLFTRHTGRGRGSRAEFEIRIAHLWTLRDGHVIRGEGYGDRAQALEAAGLNE